MSPAAGPATETLAGRYRLEHRMGTGRSCEIWRGTDLALNRPVAVKLLRAELAAQAEPLARFRAEARHSGSLLHEAVARTYDYAEPAAGVPFLVMEYVDGPSLAAVLARGPLPARWVLDIVAQVAAGLHAVHQAGLVHGGVTPSDILLGRDGQARLMDFSSSRTLGADVAADPESDLYALGLVASQCLTGGSEPSVPPVLPPSVPGPVAGLIGELTATDPALCPRDGLEVAQRAGELRDELYPAVVTPEAGPAAVRGPSPADTGLAMMAIPAGPRLRGSRPRRRWYLPLVACATTAALGAGAWALLAATGTGAHQPPAAPSPSGSFSPGLSSPGGHDPKEQ